MGARRGNSLSVDEARRLALAAQGFGRPRPSGAVNRGHLRRTVNRLGLLQIDYVNVLCPAQYQVLYSRLGPFERSLFDNLVYQRREFTEQWAHEASIVPMAIWPLLAWRRREHRIRPWGFERFLERHRDYSEGLVERIRRHGPLAAEDLRPPEGVERKAVSSWYSVPRAVLESHFGRGRLAVADRRPNFARVYDLAERVVPPDLVGDSEERAEAQRRLLAQAASALGVATAAELADYYRLPVREARPRLAELVELGTLRETRVEGWKGTAFLDTHATLPRRGRIKARSLLCPFDPLIWHRARTLRLFGFEYRVEIFFPRQRRRWGFYVLPFLFGDRLVARVDLKTDRRRRSLEVLAAFVEDGVERPVVAAALAAELFTLAAWLGLGEVRVGRRGNLARALSPAVRAEGGAR